MIEEAEGRIVEGIMKKNDKNRRGKVENYRVVCKWGCKGKVGRNQRMCGRKGIGDKDDSRGRLQRKDGGARRTMGKWDGRREREREKIER